MMTWSQLWLQDANSPIMEEFIFFHDFALVVLIFILTVVGVALMMVGFTFPVNRGLLEGQVIESIWTVIPAIILIQLAVPSLLLLYMVDEGANSGISLKAIGHQWYWSYEYTDYWESSKEIIFDSYMSKESKSRLLDVDNRVILPYQAHVRVAIGSADVLHSWALPSLGVKADACPGRLNQVKMMGHRPGVYFGQCSEICGANHSFMPIGVEFVSAVDYLSWVNSNLE